MSGAGIHHMPPYMSMHDDVLRPLVDGAGRVDRRELREPDEEPDVAAEREVVGGRVADVAGDRLLAVALDDAVQQLLAARERLVPA